MSRLKFIFDKIAVDGFAESTLLEINNYINDIQNGTEDFPRFNLSEHAGLCTAGAPLIGATIVASYAAASLTASSHAGGGQGSGPANWEIDELQEQLIEQNRCLSVCYKRYGKTETSRWLKVLEPEDISLKIKQMHL